MIDEVTDYYFEIGSDAIGTLLVDKHPAVIVDAMGWAAKWDKFEGEKPGLEELKTAVGGWIEVIRYCAGKHMVMAEEGKLMGFPKNFPATKLAHDLGIISEDDVIVGTVLIIDSDLLE